MFDNSMTGAVGFAMHADRLARAMHNARRIEAKQAATGQRAIDGSYRASLARALMALAARVAPSARPSTPGTPALAQ